MSFDVQLAVIVLALGAALLRRRPNILIVSANHLIVIRAFQNLEANGPPPSYHFLSRALFAPEMLERASVVMGVATAMLLVAAVVPWRTPLRTEPLTPIPRPVLYVIGAYFLFMFFSTRTVFQTAYASADQTVYGANAGGGIYVLMWAVVIFELRRRVDALELRATTAMGVVGLLVFLLDFIKGSTGLATGILLTAGMLMFLPGLMGESSARGVKPSLRETLRSAGTLSALFVGTALFVAFVRVLRAFISTHGFVRAVEMTFETLFLLGSDSRGEGIEAAGNGTQGAAHVLMCTFLYDTGNDRDWRSVWGPIEYTFKPSILLAPLGLERSREAAWELGDYFIHGGGINVFGELYWNGGLLCLIVVGGGLLWFLLTVDVKSTSSWFWFALACAIGPGLLQGYGYGFAQVFRGVANGALFLVPLLAYLRWASAARPQIQAHRPPTSSARPTPRSRLPARRPPEQPHAPAPESS